MDEQPIGGTWPASTPPGAAPPPPVDYVSGDGPGDGGPSGTDAGPPSAPSGPSRVVLAVTVGAVIVALGFAVYNFAGGSGVRRRRRRPSTGSSPPSTTRTSSGS
jgi:hypothetical protein